MDESGNRRLIWNDPRILSVKAKIRALRNLFSSCGLITDICIRHRDKRLARPAFIYIVGESPAEKALQLSGSDVGGWKAIVKPYPFKEDEGRSITAYVTGYDTSLSEFDIESALRNHFSSCGDISDVDISKEFASAELDIDGDDAQDNVMELDGSIMGGRKLRVKVICGGVDTFHKSRHLRIPNRGF